MRSRSLLFIGVFFIAVLMVTALPLAGAQYSITATPDKEVYTQGEIVSVVAGTAQESLVSFQIVDPSGNTLLVRTFQTKQGSVTLRFLLDLESEIGTYLISVSAVSATGEEHASASGSFQLTEGKIEGSEEFFIPPTMLLLLVLIGVLVSFSVLVGTDIGKFALFSVLQPLYTRLKHENILNDFSRGRILGWIEENPGITFSEIVKKLEAGNGTTAYHLNVLLRERFITSEKDGLYRRFFPRRTKVPKKGSIYLSALQKRIIEAIERHQLISQKKLAVELGLKKGTLHYHLKKLQEANIVLVEKKSRNNYCSLQKMD